MIQSPEFTIEGWNAWITGSDPRVADVVRLGGKVTESVYPGVEEMWDFGTGRYFLLVPEETWPRVLADYIARKGPWSDY